MHFASVDVETANPSLSSICQIGVAVFDEGRLEQSWVSLVNPETFFDPINISIHGIDENAVRFSPCWASVFPSVSALIAGSVVVSHTAFDRASIIRACERADISIPNLSWLDSAKVVRRTWTSLSRKGYGLSNVAALLGIEYRPHDALEDARCAGEVLLRAMKETGLNLAQWIDRVKQPIGASGSGRIERKGNLSGPLHGEVLVFTGSLTMLRSQAADLAAAVGCDVETGVTTRTTLLVVGDQDIRKLHGHERSSKHRKAEELIKAGQPIRILTESDFLRVTTLDATSIPASVMG